jgi:pSer/pThr/pTyr-binding forkhead associated (FHA) protein
MIICPNCQHQELQGALFCSECGAQLAFTDRLSLQSIQQIEEETSRPPVLPTDERTTSTLKPGGESQISLHLVDTEKTLPLVGRTEYTLGRVTDGQPILPDIDLTPFEAYSQGVSRLHAAIKVVNQRIVIMDLGSSNGTRVNGQKIVPNVDYPINNGDMLALGRLRIQMLIIKR